MKALIDAVGVESVHSCGRVIRSRAMALSDLRLSVSICG
jgi:hypothetical protein